MLNKTKQSNRKAGYRLIATGLVLIIFIVLADIRLRPIIQKAGEYQSRVVALRIINQAVQDELQAQEYNYTDLVELSRDAAGNIISIESNMAGINRLKARVSQTINEGMGSIGQSELKIPIGTVSGINVLYGRGPAIPVKLSPRGFASVNLVSKFTQAGINQTLHQITLNVSSDISAIIPGYTASVNVETEFIITQTVIVGTVPESYAHIIL
ncbi:MAG: sporulation protein YunB [Oscillospiraceae bacterium]|nr:sporulation protein YunB [Oscillospiraceae bacterium]